MKKYVILFLGVVIFFMDVKANDKNFVTTEEVFFEKSVAYKKDTQKPFTGTVIYMYDDKKTRENTIDFKDGIQEGEFIRYYKNGGIEEFAIFKNGKINGVYKTYYENGGLKSEAMYVEGQKEGLEKIYDKNGKLIAEYTYSLDFLNGEYRIYFPDNGKLKMEGFYLSTSVFNLRDSKIRKEYYINGNLKTERTYEDTDRGENFFEKNYREESGKLVSEGKYIDNQRDGIFKTYYENGSIYGEYGYKNGSDNGKFKEYYINGNLKEEGSIENGQINGLSKYYYETGELYLEKIWRYGEAIGQREYDKNGDLLHEYTY